MSDKVPKRKHTGCFQAGCVGSIIGGGGGNLLLFIGVMTGQIASCNLFEILPAMWIFGCVGAVIGSVVSLIVSYLINYNRIKSGRKDDSDEIPPIAAP